MSILIRGMDMPERCGICPCFHAEWPMYCQAVKADKNKRIVAPYGMPRPEWCPLIEIPPHGNLIDVDVLCDMEPRYIEDEYNSDGYRIWSEGFYSDSQIDECPIVIPASD